jgi:hypothetical protein
MIEKDSANKERVEKLRSMEPECLEAFLKTIFDMTVADIDKASREVVTLFLLKLGTYTGSNISDVSLLSIMCLCANITFNTNNACCCCSFTDDTTLLLDLRVFIR